MPGPTSPVIVGLEDREVVIAKNQDAFLPLPALVKQDDAGQATILCRWQLDEVDRDKIAAGADVFVEVMLIANYVVDTFGTKTIVEHVLPPIKVRVLDATKSRGEVEGEGY